MKRNLFLLWIVLALLLWVWWRKPSGRNAPSSRDSDPHSLEEFDTLHPDAPEDSRKDFYNALVLDLKDLRQAALAAYDDFLAKFPDEPLAEENRSRLQRRR